MLCPTNTRLSWAVKAARVGLKKNELLFALMANWAVALRRQRYLAVRTWNQNHPDRVSRLNKLSYHRRKVLTPRPPPMTPEERRQRRNKLKRERYRARINQRDKQRRRSDPIFCLRERLRATLRCAMRRQFARKSGRTFDLVGCTPTELRAHIESLFVAGMSWDNRHLWHVDHKRPLASFDLRDPDQQRAAFHYSNLQPLWSEENRRKGARLVH